MLLVYADHYISPFEGSPRAGAAEYVYRGGCYIRTIQEHRKKHRSIKSLILKVYYTTMLLVYADHYISPFEGSPRAGAAEYVQRGKDVTSKQKIFLLIIAN